MGPIYVSIRVHAPCYAPDALRKACSGEPFPGPVAYQLSITGRKCRGGVGTHIRPITPTSEMGWCGAYGDEGRAVAGEAGDVVDAGRSKRSAGHAQMLSMQADLTDIYYTFSPRPIMHSVGIVRGKKMELANPLSPLMRLPKEV